MIQRTWRAAPTLQQRWEHARPRPWAWIEAAALPIAASMLAWWGWDNPLGSQQGFPWAWLAPWVVTLRYGTLAGAFSAGVLTTVSLTLPHGSASASAGSLVPWLAGWITTLVLGEFADRWIEHLRRNRLELNYANEQLQRLSRQHYILRLSHDRLEQELLHQPLTLRTALEQLRRLGPDTSDAQAGQALLHLLGAFAKLQHATLHRIVDAQPEPIPLAHLGSAQLLRLDDPMVVQAMQRRRLAHARDIEQLASSQYRAVLPFGTETDRPQWLLVVHHLPFLALHDGTLLALQVLCDDFASLRQAHASVGELMRRCPGCQADFVAELQRLWRLQQRWTQPSTLGVLETTVSDHAKTAAWLSRISAQLRSLDVSCHPKPDRLLILLPLTHGVGSEGFVQRIDQWLRQQGTQGMQGAGIRWRARTLDARPDELLCWALEDA